MADAVQRKQRFVTFEVRVPAEHETDPSYAHTLSQSAGLTLTAAANRLPVIDSSQLYTSGFACTQLKPYPPRNFAELQAVADDADGNDRLSVEFAIWPVGHPDVKTTYTDDAFIKGRVASVRVPATALTQGTAYVWQARTTDGLGFAYHWDDLGVVGVCDSSGDHGRLVCPPPFTSPGTIRANTPGGRATVTLSTDAEGPRRLAVRSIDAAGNDSPTTYYEVRTASSQPSVHRDGPESQLDQDVLFVLTPAAGITGVTAYEITRDGVEGSETRGAEADGTAYYSFTVTEPSGGVTVRSHSDNGFVSAPARWTYSVG